MSSELVDVLRHLLGDSPHVRAISDVGEWWERHTRVSKSFATTIGRALVGGFASDRLGYAFASGYREALTSLVPSLVGVPAAFCVSEDAGSSPRDIETCFESSPGGFSLRGYKSHVTLGTHAEELLVVGHIGVDDHDRKRIRVARVPANRHGIELTPLPPFPFAPEITHATLRLDNVHVSADEMLPGDGYDAYVKAFRTTEDLHVIAAAVGHMLRIGQMSGWGPAELEALAAFVAAIFPLARVDPMDAAVHVAVGGIQRRFEGLINDLPWDAVDEGVRRRFKRDAPLLRVAKNARDHRLRVAWRRLRR